ncbi:MAG: extracellular solute-binding protein [Eubacteriales bacterium]|nr:extracellular solute-binding protein [Eubacteriales bacterium]
MKRIMAAVLALLILCGLTGCGEISTDELPEPETPEATRETSGGVTLNVVTSYGGDDGNRRVFERAVASYERITGNRVNDGSSASNEEWKAKVMTDFDTGSEPDVLFFFTNADADPLINGGKVVSIEEIRDKYPDYATNMKPAMLAEAADGLHYAVPATGYWENMFVNKAVLDACDVAVPRSDYTWDQFLLDCQTIRDKGYTPIACSLFEIPHYWFEFAVMNNGSLDSQLDLPCVDYEGKLVMDAAGEKWVAALNDIKELYDRGFFPRNTLTATDAETVALFGEGQAAFLIDGSWKVGYLSENYSRNLNNFLVSYVPGKGQRRASEAIGGISMGYFITRKAWDDPAKQEAAVKFVAHMTADEVLSTFVTTEVTALVNGARPMNLSPLQQSAAEVNATISGVTQAVQDTITGEAKGELFASIQKVVTGQMTPETAIANTVKRNKK